MLAVCFVPGMRVHLRIDKRSATKSLFTAVRRCINGSERIIRDAKALDSKRDPMIQLADMVVGCAASAKDKGGADLLEILRPRIEVLVDWPLETKRG